MKLTKRIISLLVALTLILSLALPIYADEPVGGEFRDITSAELLDEIRIGWNLGNTFDTWGGSYNFDTRVHNADGWLEANRTPIPADYETGWGGVITNPEIFKAVKTMGFKAVRLPVTWGPHMDAEGNIDEAWMARVEEVVNMIIDEGLYCILNVHHDSGHNAWISADAENYDVISARFKKLWSQIADRFKNYGEMLIFESYNEILDPDYNWVNTSEENFKAANDLNQDFIDVVRASGGYNDIRHLCVNTYAASSGSKPILDAFVLPEDPTENRLFAQVHCYNPAGFCWDVDYATPTSKWFENRDQFNQELHDIFSYLEETFVKKGIPLIIGEFSSNNKNNTEEREGYAHDFVTIGREHGISAFIWWDVNFRTEDFEADPFVRNGGLMDRGKAEWLFPTIAKSLVDAAFPEKLNAEQFKVEPIEDITETGEEIKPSVVVTYGDKTLTEGVDYSLVYENNIEPGVATVYVVGEGEYNGTVSVNFNILENSLATVLIIVGCAAAVVVVLAVVVTIMRKKKA